MAKKIFFIFLLTVSLIFFSKTLNFAQEKLTESDIQWVWAEVVSVDILKGELLLRYLDYETDAEKEIAINVDEKTIYENVKAIDEIKPQDTLSVDYAVNPEGKNVATNISVEKYETPTEEPVLPNEGLTEPKPIKE